MTIQERAKKIKQNWDNLAKPLDGLGEFEKVLSQIGAVQNDESIALSPATLLIFIADNGVVEEGVSQSTCEVTYQVAKAIGEGKSTVCHMAKVAGLDVVGVDVGICHTSVKSDYDMDSYIQGIENHNIANGTKNFAKEPAMTELQVQQAMDIGREYVARLKKDGCKLLALGEMGIGNTTTSAAVLSGLLKLSGKAVCSTGAGLSTEGLNRKIKVVDDAIKKYDLYNKEPLEILRLVGGFDIAALTGSILEAAMCEIPVISDGFITGLAALLAAKLDEKVKDIVIFSHAGRENGMKPILDYFDAKPVITADMALGEGTGACIFLSAAKCALAVYHGNTQFSDINIQSYERFEK